jgi:hypothetical protein
MFHSHIYFVYCLYYLFNAINVYMGSDDDRARLKYIAKM